MGSECFGIFGLCDLLSKLLYCCVYFIFGKNSENLYNIVIKFFFILMFDFYCRRKYFLE